MFRTFIVSQKCFWKMLFKRMQHVYNGTLINLHAEGKENAETATDMDSRTQHYAMRERRFSFPAITAA
ncbi:hypothetical protein HMPREF0658_2001 [Hoylesella marshii DSM 16973 = JCM 13450]|uniref:Uncharacterized protein n=1 Tax=Hoylesella marshii DSM 16973 = JCM 13450 TaxID=862515 RepID=E0NUZ6_9BACT|nr:hypothetical protein HMPREF0658_2001 [Hoylesella marshii DSM 16973 = JCM 13450]